MANGTPADKTPENLATFPWVFTMTLQDGEWTLSNRAADGNWTGDPGMTYTVDGNRISMDSGAWVNTFTFTVGDDGSIEVTPVLPMEAGDKFVMATHPWTKIEGPVPSSDPAAELNGVYRWTITDQDLEDGEAPSEVVPGVATMTLNDGTWSLTMSVEGEDYVEAAEEEFTVSGDRITLEWERVGSILTFTFSVDEDGNLHVVPVEPMNAADQFVMATHPWTKIES